MTEILNLTRKINVNLGTEQRQRDKWTDNVRKGRDLDRPMDGRMDGQRCRQMD